MKRQTHSILVIEDDANDRLLLQLAFNRVGVIDPINIVNNGAEGLAYLKAEGRYSDRLRCPYPSFLITDLKMPGVDGFAVLSYLKENPEWTITPTIVLSASSDPDDIRLAYSLGASSYIVKPVDLEELFRVLKLAYDYWQACDFPYTDPDGRQMTTNSSGKLGQQLRAPSRVSH